jgi:hypothetical protein
MSGLRSGFQSLIAVAAALISLTLASSAEAGRSHRGGYGASYGGGRLAIASGHSYGGDLRVAHARPIRFAPAKVVRSYSGGGYHGSSYIHASRHVAYTGPVRYSHPVRYQPTVYRQVAYVNRGSTYHRPRCVC